MFKVLITSSNYWDSWDSCSEIPYLLKKGGCEVDVFCSKNSWLLSNKYYDNWINIDIGDPLYADKLIELVNKNEYQWVILADDVAIDLVNKKIEDENTFLKIMPIYKIENRNILSSKNGFSDFCQENKIATPLYFIYENEKDFEVIKEKLKFPVIVKRDFSWGGFDMSLNNSIDELKISIHELPENKNLLIQEFISGEEIGVEALFREGILLNFQCAKILDYGDSKFTFTTRREYYDDDNIKVLLEHLGKQIGLNGFASITYIQDNKSGIYYLIEVDPRPNSWCSSSRFISGIDFAEGIKKIRNGDFINGYHEVKNYKPKIEITLFFKDVKRILKKNDFKGLMRWIFNINGYWRFLPFYDLKLTKRIFIEIGKKTVFATLIHRIKKMTIKA